MFVGAGLGSDLPPGRRVGRTFQAEGSVYFIALFLGDRGPVGPDLGAFLGRYADEMLYFLWFERREGQVAHYEMTLEELARGRTMGAALGGQIAARRAAPADCGHCRMIGYTSWMQHLGHKGFRAVMDNNPTALHSLRGRICGNGKGNGKQGYPYREVDRGGREKV